MPNFTKKLTMAELARVREVQVIPKITLST